MHQPPKLVNVGSTPTVQAMDKQTKKKWIRRFTRPFSNLYDRHEVCHHNHTFICKCSKCLGDMCWPKSNFYK